jgi:hypothetical protein
MLADAERSPTERRKHVDGAPKRRAPPVMDAGLRV